MDDHECTEFLQQWLPRLRLRWAGFRKVRRQVCRRIGHRMRELGLSGLAAYSGYLESHPGEWPVLDSMCRITISRFYRDMGVFDTLRTSVLPSLAEKAHTSGESKLRCWSAGCGSGEEPYTLQILWKAGVMPAASFDLPLHIIATDADGGLLERAKTGNYPESSLKNLPEEFIRQAFSHTEGLFSLRERFKEDIEFIRQDIRKELPGGHFHLILCRNLVFTYFDKALQRETLERILEKLLPGGFFIIGIHESLPEGITDVVRYDRTSCIFRKV